MKYVHVVDMRHNSTAEPSFVVATSIDVAAKAAHDFFLQYGFELRDGRPFDQGNDDGGQGGFDCFDNVKMRGQLVQEFMHSGGDGPVCCVTSRVSFR